MKKGIESIGIVVIMSALGVAGGYLFSFIPNVEVISAIIFITGFLTGLTGGMLTGTIIFVIYGFFNPYGPSPLPFLLIQCFAGGIIGVGGFVQRKYRLDTMYLFMVSGLVLTFLYDLITNLGGFILFPTGKTLLAYLIAGIPFSVIHMVSNVLIFGFVVHPLINKLKRRFP